MTWHSHAASTNYRQMLNAVKGRITWMSKEVAQKGEGKTEARDLLLLSLPSFTIPWPDARLLGIGRTKAATAPFAKAMPLIDALFQMSTHDHLSIYHRLPVFYFLMETRASLPSTQPGHINYLRILSSGVECQ